jgi:cysteine sulfinate desulfinase/cysteine desulfurase-like protein
VLRAIGAEEDIAHSSIRFGIGRFTTQEEIDYTADQVCPPPDHASTWAYDEPSRLSSMCAVCAR